METKTAVSLSSDPATVAHELARGTHLEGAALALVFASPDYDADALASEFGPAFGKVPVFGCTTAGEIGTHGFSENTAVAMSFRAPGLRVGAGLAANLRDSALSGGREAALAAAASLVGQPDQLSAERHVAMCLIDGRSQLEESFVAGAASSIPAIDLVGGSASDFLGGPPRARVFAHGEALTNAGLLLIFELDVPFTVIKSAHMIPTDKRVVVTASDPSRRLVHEFNGRPARVVYEKLIGYDDDEPLPFPVVARNPFALTLGDSTYVRSVMEAEGDSLRFACAIENGVILRLVRPGQMLETTAKALKDAEAAVGGSMSGLVAFNCLGRYYEAEANDSLGLMADLLSQYPVIGFQTYGEQYRALHVNHTFTALAFGRGQ